VHLFERPVLASLLHIQITSVLPTSD